MAIESAGDLSEETMLDALLTAERAAQRERVVIACYQGLIAGGRPLEPSELAKLAIKHAEALITELNK